MEIRSVCTENELTVYPSGRLDSATAGEFQDYLRENFKDSDSKLTLDFSGVDFISSKGLRILVVLRSELNGRELVITGCNAAVMEVFRISGFTKKFDIR